MDFFNVPQPAESDTKISSVFMENLRNVLQNMMGYVPLSLIMQKIARDHGSAHFSDFKPIIMAMLDTYNFENNILLTAKKLFDNDHFRAAKDYKEEKVKGFRTYPISRCALCSVQVKPCKYVDLQAK